MPLSSVQPVSYAGRFSFRFSLCSANWLCLGSPEPPGHFDRIEIYTDHAIASATGMSREDFILIAMLSGGDYDVSC